ncbi:phage tail protein [Streptomyces umbrinus]|uniref:phage tail protein n=1 Tax=Streptomyces umbrinus TaxID=67370 RepID=UPI003C2C9D45
MALKVGELVGYIDLDDSGAQQGMARTEAGLADLQRSTDGRLRDMRGRFIAESGLMGAALADGIGNGAREAGNRLDGSLKAGALSIAGLSAAALGAAGVIAAVPLAVLKLGATVLAENKQVKGAFSDLSEHVKGEMQELAEPLVEPFVNAAGQLKGIFDDLAPQIGALFAGVAPLVEPLVTGVGDLAKGALPGLVTAVESADPVVDALSEGFGTLGDGIGGLLEGLSSGAGGAGSALGAVFAIVGPLLSVVGQLVGSLAMLGGPILAGVAAAAIPLIGVFAQVVGWLAQLVGLIPPGVLTAIGTGFVVIALGVKTYQGAMLLASVATRTWAAAQVLFNAVMQASPIGRVIALVVGLAAAVVIAYERSETFRNIVNAAWRSVKVGISAAVDSIRSVLNWFGTLGGRMSRWWGAAKDAAVRQALSLVSWMTGLPGRIGRAVGNLGGLLVGKGRDIVRGLYNGVRSMGGWLKDQLISFARNMIPGPIAKALGIASPSKVMAQQVGRWIPAGIVEGIESGAGAVDRTMSNLVSVPTAGQATAATLAAQSGGAVTRRGAQIPTVRLGSDGSAYGDFLIAELRHAIGTRGGDAVFVLSS